jgi:hypothetical protein
MVVVVVVVVVVYRACRCVSSLGALATYFGEWLSTTPFFGNVRRRAKARRGQGRVTWRYYGNTLPPCLVEGERKSIWNGTTLAVGIFTVTLGVR